MKLTTVRYTAVLGLQTILFIIDFSINTFWIFNRPQNAIMLVLFIIQDACLIFALSTMLLTFFSTYVFQNGLLDSLYIRFRLTIIVCMVYFILTTILHLWSLNLVWGDKSIQWPTKFIIFLIIHRLVSALYYYCYKRAAFRITDPRFYEDADVRH
ncbi:unnamed protein product [Brassicogethes aeneus]|uniref:Transmembrane protein 138 n=1 Tax=Brassicogethes aeneus TaxID=1431903 RepID=A0A9P0B3X5_BRAAE|nr:unnamed protein product [Brassicogethes aeneus]